MTTNQQLTNQDPRGGFATVTESVRHLIESVTPEQMDLPTPCPEFEVKNLIDHLVLVMQRVAVLGNGGHWTEVNEETANRDSGHVEAFQAAAHEVMSAWTDAAKLEQMYEVPWGILPGAPMMLTYTAELATHGWDLSSALGVEFEIADSHLQGALVAARMLPAEGRASEAIPFDPVVDPGSDAPILLQIAGWMGRKVA